MRTKNKMNEGYKSLKVISLPQVSEGYPPSLGKAIKINTVKDAKRLLSRLIYGLQTGTIGNQLAKDLTYLLISYVNICRDVEFETRLKDLEEKAGGD